MSKESQRIPGQPDNTLYFPLVILHCSYRSNAWAMWECLRKDLSIKISETFIKNRLNRWVPNASIPHSWNLVKEFLRSYQLVRFANLHLWWLSLYPNHHSASWPVLVANNEMAHKALSNYTSQCGPYSYRPQNMYRFDVQTYYQGLLCHFIWRNIRWKWPFVKDRVVTNWMQPW